MQPFSKKWLRHFFDTPRACGIIAAGSQTVEKPSAMESLAEFLRPQPQE